MTQHTPYRRPHHSALFYLLGAALFAGFAYVVCLL